MIQQNKIIMLWIECSSYEDAQDYHGCVYIFEWAGKPFYIGMSGINKRFGGRYGGSYRHLIEAPFMYEKQLFRLFIGSLLLNEGITENDIENIEHKLIDEMDPLGNRQKKDYPDLILKHIGDVPD